MPISLRAVTTQLAILLAIAAAGIFVAGRTVPGVLAAQAKSSGLPPAILSQMNAASARFTSAQADIRQELYDHVVHDTEVQTGQLYIIRKAGALQMGMKMLPPDAKPGAPPAQIVEFKDNKAQVLTTGTGQVDVFNATGKNQATAETMMSLGFGGSGTDLEKSWTITDQGSEQMNDGSKTVTVEKLDLVSDDPTIRNNYTHITVWLDPARDISLKQIFYQASGGKATGDTRTAVYTNIRLNDKVNPDAFAIKCPGKCTYVQH